MPAKDLIYLQRCVDLAQLADADYSPNPRVGAVLVHRDRIIGEGYFQRDGQSHAEVNCVASVKTTDRHLISQCTIYVSLEPCCFHGRTPACTSLILDHKIPKVVTGAIDQTAEVSGQGLDILRNAGVDVITYPSFKATTEVALPRQLYAAEKRPYILLKFAKSADGFMAPAGGKDYWITGKISRRLVHFWRSRTRAILIGAGTLIKDDPRLDTRFYPGPSPQAFVIDPKGIVRGNSYRLLQENQRQDTVLVQTEASDTKSGFRHVFIPDFVNGQAISPESARKFLEPVLDELYTQHHNHITVEGGSWLLHLFIMAGYWDEARVFTGTKTFFEKGLKAPELKGRLLKTEMIGNDRLEQWLC